MQTYNHYINGKKVATYEQNTIKTKRHALAHYRHTKRIAAIKDTAVTLTAALVLAAVIVVSYLVGTN